MYESKARHLALMSRLKYFMAVSKRYKSMNMQDASDGDLDDIFDSKTLAAYPSMSTAAPRSLNIRGKDDSKTSAAYPPMSTKAPRLFNIQGKDNSKTLAAYPSMLTTAPKLLNIQDKDNSKKTSSSDNNDITMIALSITTICLHCNPVYIVLIHLMKVTFHPTRKMNHFWLIPTTMLVSCCWTK